jgi:hypothetical protein
LAALASTEDDDGGGADRPSIKINSRTIETDGIINAVERSDGVEITGTTDIEARVVVEMNGVTRAADVDAEGKWSVNFLPSEVPEGEQLASITATATNETGHTTTASGVVEIDTVLTGFSITSQAGGDDGIVNAEEAAGGLVVAGTTEPGSSVTVQLGEVSREANVDAQGNWTVTFSKNELPDGEQSAILTARSTDPAGNMASETRNVIFDTDGGLLTISPAPIATDDIVNQIEASNGVVITGTANPSARVDVTLDGVSKTVQTNSFGTWRAIYTAGEIRPGEYDAQITAFTVDAAGNELSRSDTVKVDTLVRDFKITSSAGGDDGLVNAQEALQGLTVTGTTELGASVSVSLDGVSRSATVDAQGNWTATFSAPELPSGEQTVILSARSTDRAGNTATETRNVVFDTDAGLLTISQAPIESDDIINQLEASDGVVITGRSNPFAMVNVTLEGVSKTVETDDVGNWRANYAAVEIRPGEYEAQITAFTVDGAGNELRRSDSVEVDTFVRNFMVNANPLSADNIVNSTEKTDGITLSGTTEPGATVTVVAEGVSRVATVDAGGNWTVRFSGTDLPNGTRTTTAQIVTEDRAGNMATTTKTFQVDTEVVPLTSTSQTGGADGVVSETEAAQGVTLTGQVEPGSSVEVIIGDQRLNAQVNGSTWTVTLPSSVIPMADGDIVPIQIAATDRVGNTTSIAESIVVDNVSPDMPNVIVVSRDQTQSVRSIVLQSPDEDIVIEQISASGIQVVGYEEQTNFVSGETVYNFNPAVPDGSNLYVMAVDEFGNMAGTFVALSDPDDNGDVPFGSNLDGRRIDIIDLEFTPEAMLTITEAQIVAMTGEDNTVRVLGNTGETVRISGASRTGSRLEDGQNYNIYELGEATVLIDEDITNVTI